ncbi:MAG: class I SAM-dependent methyltransferase [Lachnospiraceae bacterium]|nr:class I SAM-dependent methyltransferase [Lachnospiraceae bacterium]
MGGKIVLSKRMQAVADLVTPGSRVADVGCDHGYIPIYLIQQQRAEHVLAMDVNEGPLIRAREHVEEAGLLPYITLRLSDGLRGFSRGEADTLICAGMGGRLMQKILEREPDKTHSLRELILQPQSEIPQMRRFLADKGYLIIAEDMILEEGKFYPMMKAVRTGNAETLSETEKRFGPVLLKQKHPVLKQYLFMEWQKGVKLEKELASRKQSRRISERLAELQREMVFLKEAAQEIGADYERNGELWLQLQ